MRIFVDHLKISIDSKVCSTRVYSNLLQITKFLSWCHTNIKMTQGNSHPSKNSRCEIGKYAKPEVVSQNDTGNSIHS